jgi:hypothetical protein
LDHVRGIAVLVDEPDVVRTHREIDVFRVNPSGPKVASEPIAFEFNFLSVIVKSTVVDSVVRACVEGANISATTVITLSSMTLISGLSVTLVVLYVLYVLRMLCGVIH